jgi:hypothetical protein
MILPVLLCKMAKQEVQEAVVAVLIIIVGQRVQAVQELPGKVITEAVV